MLSWAHDGENPCGELSRDCNRNPQYSQCQEYPEATFLWYATSTFSNYIRNIAQSIIDVSLIMDEYTVRITQSPGFLIWTSQLC